MKTITFRHKIGFYLSIYVFVVLFIAEIILYVSLRFAMMYEPRKAISIEAQRILENNIKLDEDQNLSFIDNTGGRSVEALLNKNDISMLLVDANQQVIKNYGSFIWYQHDNSEINNYFKSLILNEANRKAAIETTLYYGDDNMVVSYVPLMHAGKVLGVLLLGTPIENLDLISSVLVIVLEIFILLAMIISFFVGRNLSIKLMSPFKKITKLIDSVDTNNLNKTLHIGGHNQDEFVILSKKFNDMLTRLRKSPIENISLINLVNEILEVFKSEIEQKGLNINVIIKENAFIELPYEYAKVLFYNLISNSIKYSEKGKDVYITGEYIGKKLKVGVADEGIGMSEQEIKNIFSDTYKDYFDKFHISSIGVGLSVVKIICDIHGIEIDLKSKKGIGTIVELVFPEAVSNQN